MNSKIRLLSSSVSALIVLFSAGAIAADFGTTGLIDIPSARMMEDGEFKFAMSRQTVADIYSLNYQVTPWFESTFRYTIFNPDKVAGSGDGLYDRSYEVKLRLIEERRLFPQVALGIRDFLGTGAWGSEYLVASKSIGAFDFTMGAGWGRLAERSVFSNPLTNISDRFSTRDAEIGLGGKPSYKNFFSGPDIGLFGGLTYDFEDWNTRFLVEYNSDSYQRERNFGTIPDADPISYGVEWEPVTGLVLGINRQQGNQTGFYISASANTKAAAPRRTQNLVVPVSSNLAQQTALGAEFNTWYGRLLVDVEGAGMLLRSAYVSDDGKLVRFELSNQQFNLMADAINRFLTLAEIHLPPQIQIIEVILNEDGVRGNAIRYQRQFGDQPRTWLDKEDLISIIPGAPLSETSSRTRYRIPNVAFGADVAMRVSLFDPDRPARYQTMLKLTAAADLGNYFGLYGTYFLDIHNDFDDITRPANSVLPHVRTEIARYLKEGDTGIDSLFLQRKGNLGRDVYYRSYTGILEEMYAGVGSEFLYSPFSSRLAFGFNVNWVKQRDYDKDFELLDYSVVTGHLSAYWATPWYNYDAAIHVGRYLAKDRGATIEIRRTFDNGWMVGAFATFTNVSSEDFGEGSFDKGLYFKIPLDQILPGNTKASYSNSIRSVQRDGGQRLEGFGTSLWFDLRSSRYDALDNYRLRMVPGA
tara:strand:+ start:36481 stop:38571 length:2091 start_codon:yes stop_codon:yes gene_type:complete